MKHATRVALVAMCSLVLGSALAAPPDFSGLWTASRDGKGGPARENFAADFAAIASFTTEAKTKIAEYRALVEESGDTPGGWCVPTGMPGALLLGGGYPMELIQRPEQLTFLFEAHAEVRRVYLAGPKVSPVDLLPSRDGYSTGHWEGETLVVETIGLKESVDQVVAHSEDAKFVERYRLDKDPQTGQRLLKADVTVIDSAFYTKPVSFSRVWAPLENGRMMDYDCTEPAWEDHLDMLRRQARGAAAAR